MNQLATQATQAPEEKKQGSRRGGRGPRSANRDKQNSHPVHEVNADPQYNNTEAAPQNKSNAGKGGKKYNNATNGNPVGSNRRGKKGRAPEVQKKIVDLRQATTGYYPDEEIFNVLQQCNFDQDRALQALKDKRQTSWSSVVRKAQNIPNSPTSSTSNPTGSSPTTTAATTVPTSAATTTPPAAVPSPSTTNETQSSNENVSVPPSGKNQRKKKEQPSTPHQENEHMHNNQQPLQHQHQQHQQPHQQQHQQQQHQQHQQPHQQQHQQPQQHAEKPYNADAKIADLEQQVAKDLSVIENKANYLKNIQEELRMVKAERDAQIQSLQSEKVALVQKREQFEIEIEQIKARVTEIDGKVKHLQLEKDQKTKILEEKYSQALVVQH